MSRRNLIPLIALMTMVAAGVTTTGYLLGWHESQPLKEGANTNAHATARPWSWSWYSDLAGRTWRLSGNYEGCLRLESGDRVITTVQSSGAFRYGAGPGEIRVTVNGREYRIQGLGTHEIRDSGGTLLGRLRLEGIGSFYAKYTKGTGRLQSRTRSEQARLDAEETRQTLDGLRISGGEASGMGEHVGRIDIVHGSSIRYKIQGDCTVWLTTPTRNHPLLKETVRSTPSRVMTSAPPRSRTEKLFQSTPLQVEVSFEGRTLHAKRYGKYELKIDQLDTVLIVEISPSDASILPRDLYKR